MRAFINQIGLILLVPCFIVLTSEYCQAQETKLDSLKQLLHKHNEKDTSRVNILYDIAVELASVNDDNAIINALKADSLASGLNYKSGKARSLMLIGKLLYNEKNEFSKALIELEKSLILFEEMANRSRISENLLLIAEINSDQGNFPIAIDFYEKALKIVKAERDTAGLQICYGSMGTIYARQGEYPKALEFYQKNLKISEEIGDKDKIASTLGNIGTIYSDEGSFDKALVFYNKALKMNEDADDKYGLAINYGNIAGVHLKQEEFDKALVCNQKALEILESLNDKFGIGRSKNNIGLVYLNRKDYETALLYFHQGLTLFEELGAIGGISVMLGNISEVYILMENYNLALEYSNRCLKIAEKTGSLNRKKFAYEKLSNTYKGLRKYDKALQYRELWVEVKDSIFNETNLKKITRLEVQFEHEKEKQAIALEQEKKDAVQLAELHRQKEMRNAFVIGFILVLLLVVIIFYYYRKTKKSNHQLSEQNGIITKQKEEKEMLIKEIHHRVKNNLQIISSLFNLQKRSTQHEEVKSALVDGLSRVKSVALIHELLYQNEDVINVNIKDFVTKLVSHIKASFGEHKNMQEKIDITDDVIFHIDTAVPVGLIITELITNSYKYAFDKEDICQLNITLSRNSDNNFCLLMSDNGSGLPKDFDVKKSKTLGLKMVRTLSAQLKGDIDYEFDNGAKFSLHFAVQKGS
ncbi:tetratricopeptide repeat protein [Labilibaculum sp. DW002]|uniref:Tetratricopeptide repeat protein n=1 Tax=Paralabilibaculum antarcticum TaxID=2912572 RepID=A0ABT5VUL1_9BACT|nr:tetratricopeptide repeat protein [Labilibaculum sp. DW002]MDE5419103.1 tetratricopeptide repeat protein [Labilibaculum sp. DW002]